MRQIVCPEGKEFRDLGDLVRQQSRARNFDHGSDQVIKLYFRFSNDLVARLRCVLSVKNLKLFPIHNQRNHDLRYNFNSLLLTFHRRFNNRPHLHLKYLRIGDGQAATAMAEHGIGFM